MSVECAGLASLAQSSLVNCHMTISLINGKGFVEVSFKGSSHAQTVLPIFPAAKGGYIMKYEEYILLEVFIARIFIAT